MRSLLSLGRARGAAARMVDGRGVGTAGAVGSPVRGRPWGVRAAIALAATLGALLLASASASAAPLEAPDLTVEWESPNYTTFHGVLNPLKASGAGTYEFLYKQGKAGCTGGTKVPVPPGLMTGAAEETVNEYIYGLVQGGEYTACLRVVNTTSSPSEEATSAAVTFTTPIPPETPAVVSPVKSLSARSATLEGVLNPGAVGSPGSYEFRYRASATQCSGGEVSGGSALGAKGEAVKAVVALQPNTTYTFCLLAHNDIGEQSAQSSSVTFSTPLVAPVVESETSTGVDATEARLEATVNTGNSETAYHFEYGPAAGSYDVSLPVGETHADALGVSVGVNAALTGLTPDTTYHYRVVVSNALPGSVDGPDEVFTTSAVQGTGSPSPCSNEQLRAEQPYASRLPDCRAYEMVSPLETLGNDATDSFTQPFARASVSGEAVTYASEGTFANPTGATGKGQFISRRGPEGWSTQAVTPLHDPTSAETRSSYETVDFTPELTEGVANTNAALTSESPGGAKQQLYLANFGSDSYQYLGEGINIAGSSTDLSHVVLGEGGNSFGDVRTLTEWVNGRVLTVSVNNNSESMVSSGLDFDDQPLAPGLAGWHGVSADGSRVYVTGPQDQLYLRVNAEAPQSPIVSPEIYGTGTLTEGSKTVNSLVAAAGELASGAAAGTKEFSVINLSGRFVVGQPLSGPVFAPDTTIAAVSSMENNEFTRITLSAPTINEMGYHMPISSDGPAPFTVGQEIAGNGIPVGTTITAVAPGSLTLSAPAASSGSAVGSNAGGGCTVAADACTLEVSASQRLLENPAGVQSPEYWGASANGSRVFFTSDAELTEDAYTGPDGNAANLYEYDLEKPAGERLKDLTVDKADADGAAVLGVAQISEEGSYVYFVAEGSLAGDAVAGKPNLYVSHEGGAPTFIATLSANDRLDWGGPQTSLAVATPSGSSFAFMSEESLTGYDNEQAEPGECEGQNRHSGLVEAGKCQEIYLYNANTNGLACASCNPSGARPIGKSSFAPIGNGQESLYRLRNLIEGGTLFFDSGDALVPHASDGRVNVYEYENGHVYPISDVAGGYESFFLDASPSGDDVFFGSADQLVPQDTSNNVVVYDARVGGGFPVTVAPPPCDNGDACKPPEAPQSPVFGVPGSATFSGPGNIAPAVTAKPVVKAKAKSAKCKKGYEKRKGKCVKKHRVKQKARKSSDRRGSK